MLTSSFRLSDLLHAVITGDLSTVMSTVTPANVNYTDPQYRLSLLMWAVALGRLPTVEFLLSRGASLSQLDRYSFSILHRAVWSADVLTVHTLLFLTPLSAESSTGGGGGGAGGLVEAPTSTAAAETPRANPHRHVLRTWRAGAQRLVNAVHPPTGRTPLMLAAVRGHVDMVRFLLDACGADPLQTDNQGFAAIDLAALCGHVQMVRLFLERTVAPCGDGCGDGASFVYPRTQQNAEEYCEVAQTLPQRQRLYAVNSMLNADLAEASRIAAA